MKKALLATQCHFETSCGRTPEYLSWHRLFKREFTKLLQSKGARSIAIGKPNHFDMTGFFLVDNQVWYFSVSDLRWFKEAMLIRTARDFRDYTGGPNQSLPLNRGEVAFVQALEAILSANFVKSHFQFISIP